MQQPHLRTTDIVGKLAERGWGGSSLSIQSFLEFDIAWEKLNAAITSLHNEFQAFSGDVISWLTEADAKKLEVCNLLK